MCCYSCAHGLVCKNMEASFLPCHRVASSCLCLSLSRSLVTVLLILFSYIYEHRVWDENGCYVLLLCLLDVCWWIWRILEGRGDNWKQVYIQNVHHIQPIESTDGDDDKSALKVSQISACHSPNFTLKTGTCVPLSTVRIENSSMLSYSLVCFSSEVKTFYLILFSLQTARM
jgi:hypothetical protein